MLDKLLFCLNITSEQLLNQSVLTAPALSELNKFYQGMENRLNSPAFAAKRELYAYDHVITHSWRVAMYSCVMARAARFSEKDIYELVLACAFHDLDKLYWPVSLLDKPKNELSRADWTRIMEHAVASAIFVEQLTKHQTAPGVITIIKQHHENLDGTGYPNNLTDKDISSGARIIRITDSYESMTSARPYKRVVFNHDQALHDLKGKAGGIYDENLVTSFESAFSAEKIAELNNGLK